MLPFSILRNPKKWTIMATMLNFLKSLRMKNGQLKTSNLLIVIA
ncbi:MAG: hypothetical protein ACI9XO_003349 [Paraglaciecola sp.]|jgi:hypothetical protein